MAQDHSGDPRGAGEGLAAPAPGETMRLPVSAGDVVVIGFDPGSVSVALVGNDLVFGFANGGRLVLADFAVAAADGVPPSLQLPGGVMVAGDVVVEQLASGQIPEALEAAAGEQQPDSSGDTPQGDNVSGNYQTLADLVGFIETLVFEGAVRESAFVLSPGFGTSFSGTDEPDSNLVLALLNDGPPEPAPRAGLTELAFGTALDGYLFDSTVFADLDGDGRRDDGEPSTTSFLLGSFKLLGPAGAAGATLGLVDGFDLGIRVRFTGTGDNFDSLVYRCVLRAPAGSSVISPLTTLIVEVMEQTGTAIVADAQLIVASGLGVDLSQGSLTEVDSILESVRGGGEPVQVVVAQVANTVVQIASLFIGSEQIAVPAPAFADRFRELSGLVYEEIAKALLAGPLALTEAGDVAALIRAVDARLTVDIDVDFPIPGQGDFNIVDAAASLIADLNDRADEADAETQGNAFLEAISRVSTVAQVDFEQAGATSGDPLDGSLLSEGSAGTLRMAATDLASDPGAAKDSIESFQDQIDSLIAAAIPGAVSTDADDILVGSDEPDNISGNDGNDTISGNGSGDELFGGGGDDTIMGGEGHDILDGDGGDDTLAGGNGDDSFWVRLDADDTPDEETLMDFLAAEDVLFVGGVVASGGGTADLAGLDLLIDSVTTDDPGIGGAVADVRVEFAGGDALVLVDLAAFTSFTDLEAANPGSVIVLS